MSSRSNILASLVIIVIVFGAVGGVLFLTEQYEPPRVAIVVMNPGFEDMGLGAQTKVGMNNLAGDIVVAFDDPRVLRDGAFPTTAAEAEEDIRAFAQTGRYLIIIAVGKELVPAVETVAQEFPNQNFGIIGGISSLKNVASTSFIPEEAAFLAGFIGGLIAFSPQLNNTGRVAIMASYEEDPTVGSLVYGFLQGLQLVNSSDYLRGRVTLVQPIVYLESYENIELANETAYHLYMDEEVSLIFAPIRGSIVGLRQAMLAANKTLGDPNIMPLNKTRMPLAIAAEGNLDYYGNPDPDILSGPSWITTSVVFRADMAVYDMLNETLWGQFNGTEILEYNLANGGVNLTSFEFSSTYIKKASETYMPLLRGVREMILNGTISVDHYSG